MPPPSRSSSRPRWIRASRSASLPPCADANSVRLSKPLPCSPNSRPAPSPSAWIVTTDSSQNIRLAPSIVHNRRSRCIAIQARSNNVRRVIRARGAGGVSSCFAGSDSSAAADEPSAAAIASNCRTRLSVRPWRSAIAATDQFWSASAATSRAFAHVECRVVVSTDGRLSTVLAATVTLNSPGAGASTCCPVVRASRTGRFNVHDRTEAHRPGADHQLTVAVQMRWPTTRIRACKTYHRLAKNILPVNTCQAVVV